MIEWWQPNAATICQEVAPEPVTPHQAVRLSTDCTLIFAFWVQKELNMYQMFKCFCGIFILHNQQEF